MANKHCKRKALDTHDLVSKRIKYVRKATTRNQKKKAPEIQAQTESSNIVGSPIPNSWRVSVTPGTDQRTSRTSSGHRINIMGIYNFYKGESHGRALGRDTMLVSVPAIAETKLPELNKDGPTNQYLDQGLGTGLMWQGRKLGLPSLVY